MKELISKELLSLVLGEEIREVTFEDLFLSCSYDDIEGVNWTTVKRPRSVQVMPLDTLGRLCKEWLTDGTNDIILATHTGFSNRFNETEVRSMGRVARGVKGISLRKDDKVVAMVVLHREGSILAISENGFGKRSKPEQYHATHRGSKGVITLKTTKRNGHLVSLMEVVDTDDLMIVTKQGKIVRLSIGDMNTIGRNTQGVKLINIKDSDSIAAVAKVLHEEEVVDETENGTEIENNNEENNNEENTNKE